jgi:hypothetical protein
MQKILAGITLLIASAGVMATPALARERNDVNRRDVHVVYRTSERGHDRDNVRYRRGADRDDACYRR